MSIISMRTAGKGYMTDDFEKAIYSVIVKQVVIFD